MIRYLIALSLVACTGTATPRYVCHATQECAGDTTEVTLSSDDLDTVQELQREFYATCEAACSCSVTCEDGTYR